jgi:phosphate transport system permease protein
MQDKIFRVLLILSAVVIPIIGGGIVYSLTADASGAFEHFGFWNFIFSDDWVTTAGKESYGALPFITGTLLTTILALLMCIPFPALLQFSFHGNTHL